MSTKESRIPRPTSAERLSSMKVSSKSNSNSSQLGNHPASNSSSTHQRHLTRRSTQRCSAVSCQEERSAYLPPQKQKPSYCSPMKQVPIFEKDFGPFGTVQEKTKNDSGDIASMFRRSEYQPLPCLLQQQQQLQGKLREGQVHKGPGGVIMGGTAWVSESTQRGNILIRSHLPSPNQQPVIGTIVNSNLTDSQRNLRRHDDVDRILNKYGRVSKSSIDGNKDPDFCNNENLYQPDKLQKGPLVQSYWENVNRDIIVPHRRRNVEGQNGQFANANQAQPHQQSQGRPRDVCNNFMQHPVHLPQQQMHMREEIKQVNYSIPGPPVSFTYKQSTHVFPFMENVTGQLLVEPSQIAFESRKLCVLMSDPNNNTTIEFSTNKVQTTGTFEQISSSKHERILHEVKRAMSMAETQADGTRPHSYFHVLPKELGPFYSDSKKATDEFEQKLLQRVSSARNADTHVVIGDKVFPCHSIALEAFSTYFDRLSRAPEQVQKIHLSEDEVPPDAFPVIMDWLVQSEEGRRKIPKKENLVSVYIAAKHLGIKELEQQCMYIMEKKVDANDADLLSIWEAVKSRRASCPELVAIVAAKMAASYQEIFETRRFLQMEADELFMLLSSDDISIDSEMDVYDSAVTWLLHDWKLRKNHTNKLMSTVRFGLLSPLQLTQINLCPELSKVKSEKDYSQILTYGTVKSMIDDGLAYSILDESYKSQPEELRKWVERTGIKVPPPRTCLLHKKLRSGPFILDKIALLENASNTKLKPSSSGRAPPEKSSSYTLLNQSPGLNTPRIDSRMDSNYVFHGGVLPPPPSSPPNHPDMPPRSRIPTKSSLDKLKKSETHFGGEAMALHELSKPKLLANSSNTIGLSQVGSDLERVESNDSFPGEEFKMNDHASD